MHELCLAMNILDGVVKDAARHDGAHVVAVHVRLGALSGVVAEALQSAFEIAREASPWPDARLVIEKVPIVIHCDDCDADRAVASIQHLSCPDCGKLSARVVAGRELEITALELEDASPNPAG